MPEQIFPKRVLLLLLPLIYVILFKYVPMVGNILAFKKYEVGKSIWDMEWVGLANFKRFFANYKFSQIIKNALTLALYNVIVGLDFEIHCFIRWSVQA